MSNDDERDYAEEAANGRLLKAVDELPAGFERAPRGFILGPSFFGPHGSRVVSYESSNADQAMVWLRIESFGPYADATIELKLDDARALAGALVELCGLHRMADR